MEKYVVPEMEIITFENEDLKYRASALIRAYSIYDVKEKRFLDTQKEGRHWDDRSTYLYDFINGFPIDGNHYIEWIDEDQSCQHKVKEPSPRRNVFIYENGKKTDNKALEYPIINFRDIIAIYIL